MPTPNATGWQQVGQFTPLSWTLRPTSGSITAAVGELVRASAANGSIDIAPPASPQDGGSILIIRTDAVAANVVRFIGATNGAANLTLDRQWASALLTYDATNAVWLRTALSVHHHDDRYVGLGGDQDVGGVKTFLTGIRVPSPSDPTHPVRHDDARLTNARAPLAHKSTHATGGSDALDPADIGAATSGHSHALAAHKATHATGGSDALAPADIGAATSGHTHAASAPAAHKATHATGGSDALAPVDIGAAAASHGHALADLPVAASGASSATSLVRADDSRLTDARTPTAHSHTIGSLPVAASGVSSSTAVVRADDSRLADARTPTAHASAHATGGSDPVTPAAIGAASSSHSHALAAHASTHGSAGSDPVTPAAIGAATSGHTHPTPVPTAVPMTVSGGSATPQGAGGAQFHRASVAVNIVVQLVADVVDMQPFTHEVTNTSSTSITVYLASTYEIGGTARTRSIVVRAGATAYVFGRVRGTTQRLLSVDDGG